MHGAPGVYLLRFDTTSATGAFRVLLVEEILNVELCSQLASTNLKLISCKQSAFIDFPF